MGYQTSVVVLNDALNQIENDPNFGKKLAEACRLRSHSNRHLDVSALNHANAVSVIETHHADSTTVLSCGGNHARVILENAGRYNCSEEDIFLALAEKLGYSVKKGKK